MPDGGVEAVRADLTAALALPTRRCRLVPGPVGMGRSPRPRGERGGRSEACAGPGPAGVLPDLGVALGDAVPAPARAGRPGAALARGAGAQGPRARLLRHRSTSRSKVARSCRRTCGVRFERPFEVLLSVSHVPRVLLRGSLPRRSRSVAVRDEPVRTASLRHHGRLPPPGPLRRGLRTGVCHRGADATPGRPLRPRASRSTPRRPRWTRHGSGAGRSGTSRCVWVSCRPTGRRSASTSSC